MNARLVRCIMLALLLPSFGGMLAAFADDAAKLKFDREFDTKIKPFLGKYCLNCHGAEKPKAGLNLAKFDKPELFLKDRKIWQRAAEYIESGEMPPDDAPQPAMADAEQTAGWIETYLSSIECKPNDQSPGRVTLRRLNRVEYRNTVRA